MSGEPAKRKVPSINIDRVEFPELTWKSDGDVANGLTALYKHAEARAESTITWYLRAKASKSFNSRALRLLTILLGTLGGLAPILDSAGLTGWLPMGAEATEIGFLLLGLAAACVAVDKLFGFSSGWMRYITTAMALQEDLSHLRMDWAATMVRSRSRPLSTTDILWQLERIRAFFDTIDGRVMQETRAWIAEFQTNLADIERATTDARVRVPAGRSELPLPPRSAPPYTGAEALPEAPVVETHVAPTTSVPTTSVPTTSVPTVESQPGVTAPVGSSPESSSAPLP